jgi:ribosomal protein S18 acetylase RimI-like enzyme
MENVRLKILSKRSQRMATAFKRIVNGIFESFPAPKELPKFLYVVANDENGKLIGALNADTQLGWLSIYGLWVDKKYRKAGVATKIMRAAELEAKRRRCRRVLVSSLDFQAPGFYRKLGYKRYGVIRNYLKGYTMHFFEKTI